MFILLILLNPLLLPKGKKQSVFLTTDSILSIVKDGSYYITGFECEYSRETLLSLNNHFAFAIKETLFSLWLHFGSTVESKAKTSRLIKSPKSSVS
jgi:hypothetical protein